LGHLRAGTNLTVSQFYCPDRGDVVWISFSPQSGHEQAGDRPALVLSPRFYNQKSGLAVFCPITTQVKDYPFEVKIPQGHKVSGTILSDHLKSLDWTTRRAHFYCTLPSAIVHQVARQIGALISTDVKE